MLSARVMCSSCLSLGLVKEYRHKCWGALARQRLDSGLRKAAQRFSQSVVQPTTEATTGLLEVASGQNLQTLRRGHQYARLDDFRRQRGSVCPNRFGPVECVDVQ
ncbi:hypothetical protein VTO73DRAFT_11192 [Trametes versicolor]